MAESRLLTNDSLVIPTRASYYSGLATGMGEHHIATLRQYKRSLHLRCLSMALALLTVTLAGCSSAAQGPQVESPACKELAKTIANQQQAFVARVKAIRAQHIYMQEYDRQMIAAITERRTALQSTTLTEMSVTEDVAGCSGQTLEDMRRRAQQEIVNMRAFLNDFNRALKSDPEGVYIDQL